MKWRLLTGKWKGLPWTYSTCFSYLLFCCLIAVFEAADPVNLNQISGYMGCYKRRIGKWHHRKALKSWDASSCKSHCLDANYSFAAMRFSAVCSCITEVPDFIEADDPNCKFRCEDNPYHDCGGVEAVRLMLNPFANNASLSRIQMFVKKLCPMILRSPADAFIVLQKSPCQTNFDFVGCERATHRSTFTKHSIKVSTIESSKLYFCIRHCKLKGFHYAGFDKRRGLCGCSRSQSKTVPCLKAGRVSVFKTNEKRVYKTQGCFRYQESYIKTSYRTQYVTLSSCGMKCIGTKYFGMSLRASCFCNNKFTKTRARVKDDHCDVYCKWSSPHRCGTVSSVAIYKTVKEKTKAIGSLMIQKVLIITGILSGSILFLCICSCTICCSKDSRNKKKMDTKSHRHAPRRKHSRRTEGSNMRERHVPFH